MIQEIEPGSVCYGAKAPKHPVTLQTVLDCIDPRLGEYGQILNGITKASYNLAKEAGCDESQCVQYAADYLTARLLQKTPPEMPTPKNANV